MYRMTCLSILTTLWVLSFAGAVASAGPETTRTTPKYSILPGWNLLSLPLEDATFLHQHHDVLEVWPVGPNPTTRVQSPIGVGLTKDATGIAGYWIYALTAIDFAGMTRPASDPQGLQKTQTGRFSFIGVSEPALYKGPLTTRLLRWDAIAQDFVRVPLGQELVPGFGYWAETSVENPHADLSHTTSSMPPTASSSPFPPTQVFATHQERVVHLSWTAPQFFQDGAPIPATPQLSYHVHREHLGHDQDVLSEGSVTITQETSIRENVPQYGVYRYRIRAVFDDGAGTVRSSDLSNPVEQTVRKAKPVLSPGAFEPPETAIKTVGGAWLPQAAITTHGGVKQVHLVYGQKKGGTHEIVYARSDRGGAPGSFETRITVAPPVRSRQIVDLAIAAHKDRVMVGWIEKTRTPAPSFQIRVLESHGDGRPFVARWSDTVSTQPKHDLSMALDRFGHHHMVWSEGTKVYYARNFETETKTSSPQPSDVRAGVFDLHRRTTDSRPIRHLAKYKPVGGECTCEGCWCEESYQEGQATGPGPDGSPEKSYVHWWEDAHVYAPALHVNDHQVAIVGRQVRSWDNKPVINPAWEVMYQAPVYSPEIIPGLKPTRFAVGWRKTWKRAYQVGDEALWPELGFQHQYHYEGTWHETDYVKVARRPLTDGPLSDNKRPHWENGVEIRWQVSVIDTISEPAWIDRPSYPSLTSFASGELVTVYEKGPAFDANHHAAGTLYVAQSSDGGDHWSKPAPIVVDGSVATGYMPRATATPNGEMVVVYGKADSQVPVSRTSLMALYGTVGGPWAETRLNEDTHTPQVHSVKPPHWSSVSPSEPSPASPRPRYASSYNAVPEVAAQGTLVYVPFVTQASGAAEHDGLMGTRASWDTTVRRVSVNIKEGTLTEGRSASALLRLVNADDVAVYDEPKEAMIVPQSQSFPVSALASRAPSSLGTGLGHTVWLQAGQAEVSIESGVLARAMVLVDGQPMPLSLKRPKAVANSVAGNYKKALNARTLLTHPVDVLRSEGTLEDPTENAGPKPAYYYAERYIPSTGDALYQSEYHLDTLSGRTIEHAEQLDAEDAKYLASYKRVWAYTLGIALAQASKGAHGFERARGLARYLCAKAVLDPRRENEIKGWHFSWNTEGDSWKDARLVTGASAWATHGLGVFLASPAFEELTADRTWFQRCYAMALRGLKRHRRQVILEDGTSAYLMSAGWSTQGLRNAGTPALLGALGAAESERWGYYTILDVIGYDTIDEEQPPSVKVCTAGDACELASAEKEGLWAWREIKRPTWLALKETTEAMNIVTEHNLDMLSVLNQALDHGDALGIEKTDDLGQAALVEWRDGLRDGIFVGLWDETGWKKEFLDTAKAHPDSAQAQKMREVLKAGTALGRVITGSGDLVPMAANQDSPATTYRVGQKSVHSAIDNCSWLSLSVDHAALDTTHVARLDRCLTYTLIQYAKPLSFCDTTKPTGCPGAPSYYGTHYFQNAFRDPYIAPSHLQESSYHLEATMGLILGLLVFVEAHPDHPSAQGFEQEARHLWADAQRFIQDHGFPYSSQRIPNLSTLLLSSTAVIWFMDVYEYFEKKDGHFDRPLKHYAAHVDLFSLRSFIDSSYADAIPVDGLWAVSGHDEDGPYSVMHEQALLLMAAVSRRDAEGATQLTEGLLGVLMESEPNMPYAVDAQNGAPRAPYGDAALASRLLTLYALNHYLVWADTAEHDAQLREKGWAVLSSSLFALEAEHKGFWVGGPDSNDGLFRSDEETTHVDTDESVLGYFLLRQAVPVDLRFEWWADRLAQKLHSLCWDPVLEWPLKRVLANNVNEVADSPKTLALCALFHQSRGEWHHAQRLLDGLAFLRSRSGSKSPELTSRGSRVAGLLKDPLGFLNLIGEAWVRRALAPMDPREEELALLQLSALSSITETESNPVLGAAANLLEAPRGAWGVDAGPAVILRPSRGSFEILEAMSDTDYQMALQTGLAERIVEVLTALLATDNPRDGFDILFRELLRLRFGIDSLSADAQPSHADPSTWVARYREAPKAELVQKTVYQLGSFCEHEQTLVGASRISLDDATGFERACRVVERHIPPQIRARVGYPSGELFEVLALDPGGETHGMHQLVLAIHNDLVTQQMLAWPSDDHAEPPSSGIQPGAAPHWTGPELLRTYPHSPPLADPSVAEVQEAIRSRLVAANRDGINRHLNGAPMEPERGPMLVFALPTVDALEALHPASPHYWKPASVALRVSLSDEFRPHISFVIPGRLAHAPRHPRTDADQVTSHALRSFVNTWAEGDLFSLGQHIGIDPAWLHTLLKTGVLPEEDFRSLGAMGLGAQERNGWRTRFNVREAGSDSGRLDEFRTWVQHTGIPDGAFAEDLNQDFAQPKPVAELNEASLRALQRIRGAEKGLYQSLKTLLSFDPHVAAWIAPWTLPAGMLLTGKQDADMTTMVVFDEAPSGAWVRVGSVAATDVMREIGPLSGVDFSGVTYSFESESDLRSHGVFVGQDGSPNRYDPDRIYGFDAQHLDDLLPLDTVFPDSSARSPGFVLVPDAPKIAKGDEQVHVYALDSDLTRSTIVDEFLRHHLWWQSVLSIAQYIVDDGARRLFLSSMKGMILGWFFNTHAAEHAGGWPAHGRNGRGDRPFWWSDQPGYASYHELSTGGGPQTHPSPSKPDTGSEGASSIEATPSPGSGKDASGVYGPARKLSYEELRSLIGLNNIAWSNSKPLASSEAFHSLLKETWRRTAAGKTDDEANTKGDVRYHTFHRELQIYMFGGDADIDELRENDGEDSLYAGQDIGRLFLTGPDSLYFEPRLQYNTPAMTVSAHYAEYDTTLDAMPNGDDLRDQILEEFLWTQSRVDALLKKPNDEILNRMRIGFGIEWRDFDFAPAFELNGVAYFELLAVTPAQNWGPGKIVRPSSLSSDFLEGASDDGNTFKLDWWSDNFSYRLGTLTKLNDIPYRFWVKKVTDTFRNIVPDGQNDFFLPRYDGHGGVLLIQYENLGNLPVEHKPLLDNTVPLGEEYDLTVENIRKWLGTELWLHFGAEDTHPLIDGLPLDDNSHPTQDALESLFRRMSNGVDRRHITPEGDSIPGFLNWFRIVFGPALVSGRYNYLAGRMLDDDARTDVTTGLGLARLVDASKNSGVGAKFAFFTESWEPFIDLSELEDFYPKLQEKYYVVNLETAKRIGNGSLVHNEQLESTIREGIGSVWDIFFAPGLDHSGPNRDPGKAVARVLLRSKHVTNWSNIEKIDASVLKDLLPEGAVSKTDPTGLDLKWYANEYDDLYWSHMEFNRKIHELLKDDTHAFYLAQLVQFDDDTKGKEKGVIHVYKHSNTSEARDPKNKRDFGSDEGHDPTGDDCCIPVFPEQLIRPEPVPLTVR